MTKYILLFTSCVLLNSQLCAADKPNIIFAIADQWRAQAFGFAGDPNAYTPHMDELKKESLDCKNAISTVSVCCPARASLFTGQRALTHGVFLNDVPLNPNAVSLAKVLKQAGYDTGYIGKWHLNGDGRSEFIPRDRRQGFDYWKALECTHNYIKSYYYADGPEKLEWKGYDAIAQTRDAQQYIADHAKSEKPFLLVLAWGPPHDPYQLAPEQYRAKFKAGEIQLRPNVPESVNQKARLAQAGYYANCAALDDCMGDLMQTLRDNGLGSNTIVIFTADHGDLLGSHEAFNKQQPFDESIRVPLLLHWPKGFGTSGGLPEAMINSEDIMPTLLGLCGVPIPKTVEGLDYSDYLHGGKNPSDGATVISSVAPFGQWERRVGGREYRGVRTQRYTYVRDLNGPWYFFDNQTDLYQTNNLVNKPELAKLQAELEATLKRKLKEQGDDFLPAAVYIRKWGYKVNAYGTAPYTN